MPPAKKGMGVKIGLLSGTGRGIDDEEREKKFAEKYQKAEGSRGEGEREIPSLTPIWKEAAEGIAQIG